MPVTRTRMVEPTSSGVSAYVVVVSPGMSAHAAPVASQRRHCRSNAIVGVPVQVPVAAVSTWPSRAVPEIDGSTVFTGGAGATTAEAAEVADVEPAPFVAVTTTRSVPPTSARTGVWPGAVAPGMSAQPEPPLSQRRH